jgi:hypothetical protein
VRAGALLGSLPVVPTLDKVGRSVVTGRGTLLRSGAAAGVALVALSTVSAAASALRQRTVST